MSGADAQLAEVVVWLHRNGFPFDWHSQEPAPLFLRAPLAKVWAEADNEPVEHYLWALDQEQAWAVTLPDAPGTTREKGTR